MIYLGDDYLEKYSSTISYLIGRSYKEGYTFSHIEKTIAYSLLINEFERSNVTLIAFTSMEKLYSDIFPYHENNYSFSPYDIFGWVGYTYLHLFLNLEITFEALFYVVPIEEMLRLYKLYHEMDFMHTLDYVKSEMKYSLLDIIMKKKKISNRELMELTNISVSTINALRYGKRDIAKLEAGKLLQLAKALSVKIETLLPNIGLNKKKTSIKDV